LFRDFFADYASPMRRVLAPVVVWSCTFVAAACSRESASVGLNLRVPAGLLDGATAVELRVSQGALCNPATGHVKDEVEPETFPLDRCGSASWCKTIKLDKDDGERVFHVLASNGGKLVAEGCTTAAIDKDPLDVAVKVRRYNEPGCCNDGKVQSTEQCDSGIQAMTDCLGNAPSDGNATCLAIVTDDVCECDCRAREIVLSAPGTSPSTTNTPNSKSELSLAFSGASGSTDVAGSLRAVFTDKEGLGGNDINLRTMRANLTPIASGPLSKQLRLPATCSNTLVTGIARDQRGANIARVSAGVSAVVFIDNKVQPQQYNVSLSALGDQGCADKEPIIVNTNATASCEAADIAGGPEGSALVVWNQGGALRARIWNSSGALTPAGADIELGAMSKKGKPHVAGSSKGWVVVYTGANDDDIFMTALDSGGALTVTAKQVNVVTDGIQDQPDVAAQADGRAVVVWQSGEQILFQRYDANGQLRSGDQDAPLAENAPSATAPAAPAVAGGSGWFAATWGAGDGTIWARFIGVDAGFGYNHVDGQNEDFLASHPLVMHPRSAPAVAIGESFVAIGWTDASSEEPVHGIVVRRFPLPE